MKQINPSSPASQDIVVARCESLREAQAMARWITPVLAEWPKGTWHAWLVDATDRGHILSAAFSNDEASLDWRGIEHDSETPHDAVCSLLGGQTGLVILAHHVIAATAVLKLDGLVSRMTCFATTDPLARSFRKPFASYGIALAA